jgi:hypothetical protein
MKKIVETGIFIEYLARERNSLATPGVNLIKLPGAYLGA